MASKLVHRLMFSRFALPARSISTTEAVSKISQLQDVDRPFQSVEKRVGVIGIPSSHGQKRKGVDLGPGVLRDAKLISRLQASGADVKDYGDIPIISVEDDEPAFNMVNPRTHAIKSKQISDEVAKIVSEGRMCITLGGDHSLALGSVHGHASVHPNLCVIWIDAHADLNTPLTSPSGNFHGMPNSFLIHDVQEYVPAMSEFSDLKSCIGAEDIVFIGLRDLDPGETVLLEKHRIKHYSMHDVDSKGIVKVLQETLDHLLSRSLRPIHLSIDIDSLDPLFARSTGTPVRGGLTLRELLYLTEEVYKTGALSAVDLVEVNPKLRPDHREDTVEAAVSVLTTAIGDSRSGAVPVNYEIERPEDFGVASRADEYVEFDESE